MKSVQQLCRQIDKGLVGISNEEFEAAMAQYFENGIDAVYLDSREDATAMRAFLKSHGVPASEYFFEPDPAGKTVVFNMRTGKAVKAMPPDSEMVG